MAGSHCWRLWQSSGERSRSPPLARLLGTVPLSGADWLVLGTGVLWPVAALEVLKAWGRLASLGRPGPNGTGDTPGVPGQISRNH